MRQSILNAGDLVKYLGGSDSLDAKGYVKGQVYGLSDTMGLIGVQRGDGFAILIHDVDGFNDNADHFAKHVCPVILPVGSSKVGA